MNAEELDRLEQDLAAVAGRLGGRLAWKEVEPRVRWALRRPAIELAGTIALIAACVAAGFWVTNGWLVAGGLLLAVLPDRVRAYRERRRGLAEADEGELLALVQRELELRLAHHFAQALLSVALALVFVLVAVLAPDSRPGWIAAAALAAVAGVRFFWFFPRAYRALRDFRRDEVAA